MPGFISDSLLARELIRISDEAIVAEDDANLRAYFAADYVFHGPGGALSFESNMRRETLPPHVASGFSGLGRGSDHVE